MLLLLFISQCTLLVKNFGSKWWSQRDATSADTINAKRLHTNKAVKEIPCLQNLSEWIWPVKLFISFKLTLPLTLYQSNLFIKYKLLQKGLEDHGCYSLRKMLVYIFILFYYEKKVGIIWRTANLKLISISYILTQH